MVYNNIIMYIVEVFIEVCSILKIHNMQIIFVLLCINVCVYNYIEE